MSITALPTPPSRDDPTNFATRADAFLGALPTFATEANALAVDVNADAVAAAAAEVAATAAAAGAQAAANVTKWVSGTTYAEGVVVWSPITYLSYRRKTAGAGTTDPSADSTNWAQAAGDVTLTGTQTLTNKTIVDPILTLGAGQGTAGQVPVSQGAGLPPVWGTVGAEIIRVSRASNTALSAANIGNLIDITSGTFTQTFDAAASLGDGWFCYIQNSGTGDITLDPDGSETIDGLTSYIMYPGEVRLVQCDGTGFNTVVLQGFYRKFTASGTFTKPPGYSTFGLDLISGGGGGSTIGGGGGGGRFFQTLAASAFGTTETVTVGAGGAGSTTNAPTSGGDTSVGSLLTVYGSIGNSTGSGYGGGVIQGYWGSTSGYTNFAFVGGQRSNGNQFGEWALYGGGSGGYSYSTASNGRGGDSYFGAGGGGGIVSGVAQKGGGSGYTYGAGNGGAVGSAGASASSDRYCGAGGGATVGGVGGAGGIPGGGGGAGNTGGAGARGEVRIWGIA